MALASLKGIVALVTGGARGIGLATSRALAAQGARVALCDIDIGEATRAVGSVRDAVAQSLDVRDRSRWDVVVREVEAALGPVDLLVNNAGIMPLGPFLEASEDVLHRQIDINVWGVIHGMRAVLPGMVARRRGHVVNVASVVGKAPAPWAAAYSATKHAVVGLTEAVRWELRETGIGFSYILPAFVSTELTAGTKAPRWPRTVTPEDVADALVDSVRTGRVDVYVPATVRPMIALPAILPRAIYERIGEGLGLADIFAHVDAAARESYRNRSE